MTLLWGTVVKGLHVHVHVHVQVHVHVHNDTS